MQVKTGFEKRKVLRRQWKTPRELRSTNGSGIRWRIRRRRAGWWWGIELIRNTKSRRKLVLQVRCGMPEEAVCDLETGVNWWLEKSDQCGWLSWSRGLDCDEIAHLPWVCAASWDYGQLPTLPRISSSTRPDSSKTLALYKSFIYLLTYLLTGAVLAVVSLSVRLSVCLSHACFVIGERRPLPSEICAQSDPTPFETRRLRQISTYNVSTINDSERVARKAIFGIKVNFYRIKSATKFLFVKTFSGKVVVQPFPYLLVPIY